MEKTRLRFFRQVILAGVLTFIIPAAQWLTSELFPPASTRGVICSSVIILGICLWYTRTKDTFFLPAASFWKAIVYTGSMIILILLIINIRNAPIAKITGQARAPLEVLDVIVLVPLAEELIFRGVLWSVFEKFSLNNTRAIVMTSLLFGVEHLGYWAQAGLPLPPQAFLHALSMVGAGLCFGALRWRSGLLAVPAVIHMLANGAILFAQ
ncbi:MAG TPA: CPBP family intramembrane glutamic endopeptidase [Anaerolineales bacterium]|nr:CPBP family intramembrane glutamic endopeptidase [Anaerolineales bacterium]